MIKSIFFDVANTLLYKPRLYSTILEALREWGTPVDEDELVRKHKLLSEFVEFPDKTNEEFYRTFNSQLVLSLGIDPHDDLLSSLFKRCSYLPWEPFPDVQGLANLKVPLGIVSNWDDRLVNRVEEHFGDRFSWVLGSADTGLRKPDERFFLRIIKETGHLAGEIMVVGDSVRLDIVPAARLGMRAVLVDRINLYPHSSHETVNNLFHIAKLIES